jgi:hypothetical protein
MTVEVIYHLNLSTYVAIGTSGEEVALVYLLVL